jgi:hypothetical protein
VVIEIKGGKAVGLDRTVGKDGSARARLHRPHPSAGCVESRIAWVASKSNPTLHGIQLLRAVAATAVVIFPHIKERARQPDNMLPFELF